MRIRSVQDDSTGENILMAAMMGERNYEDSRRKAAATSDARRRAAQRGEWCGMPPDGYVTERTPQGAVIVRKIVKNPERIEVYTLLWDMARGGATVNDIVREFRRRGFRTAPRRAPPQPFDGVRLNKAIVNPFYAGLMVSRGEIIGEGNWLPYVEPDEWHRLQGERRERGRHQPRPVSDGVACAARSMRRVRWRGGSAARRCAKDGSRRRTYTCQRHMDGAGACMVKPFDAEQVEGLILDGLDRLLGDVEAWAEALRRWFDAFVLGRVDRERHIVPVLSGDGVGQALRDRTHRVTATLVGDSEHDAGLLTMLSLPGTDSAAPSRMAQAVVAEDGSIRLASGP